MAKGKLSSAQVRALKPLKNKISQRFSDGGGLYFHAKQRGQHAWEFRYRRPTGGDTYIVLGTYPSLSLSDARQNALEYRELLKDGVDPQVERQRIELEKKATRLNVLKLVFESWLESKEGQLKPKTLQDIRRKLEIHVLPKLGNMPVESVTAPIAIGVFRPLAEKRKFETIKRCIQLLKAVMNHAVNLGIIPSHNLHGIGEVFQKPRVRHVASLEPSELPELLRHVALSTMRPSTKLMFEWQLHTMARFAEAATARWTDIDLETRIWTIPESRMKNNRVHKVPLTDQAIAILEQQRIYSDGCEYVFPAISNRKTHAHTESINKAFNRLGLQNRTTAHGLRSLASTTLHEQGFDTHVIEAALSHSDKNRVREAYNRSNFFNERVRLMSWWSIHISSSSVIDLSK